MHFVVRRSTTFRYVVTLAVLWVAMMLRPILTLVVFFVLWVLMVPSLISVPEPTPVSKD
jgi:hypothetical protein